MMDRNISGMERQGRCCLLLRYRNWKTSSADHVEHHPPLFHNLNNLPVLWTQAPSNPTLSSHLQPQPLPQPQPFPIMMESYMDISRRDPTKHGSSPTVPDIMMTALAQHGKKHQIGRSPSSMYNRRSIRAPLQPHRDQMVLLV